MGSSGRVQGEGGIDVVYSSGAKQPNIDESAYVAPTAVISGDVTIGPGCAVLHGAVITAEGAGIEIGEQCVIMEHAVLRATSKKLTLGDRSIIGVGAYVVDTSLGADSHVPNAATLGESVRTRNAAAYAGFLRKAHADDAAIEPRKAPKHAAAPETLPKPVDVQGVDSAMMLELQEMEHRRQESLRKQRGNA